MPKLLLFFRDLLPSAPAGHPTSHSVGRMAWLLTVLLLAGPSLNAQVDPLPVGVAGLTHSHVHGIFNSEGRGDIEIVGIVEDNDTLVERYRQQYGFDPALVYPTLEAMVAARQPAAVAAFGNIFDHLSIVEFCAPRGIHVMVEKPLAVSADHARRMAELARTHGIHLLTNYETTWYPTNHEAYALVKKEGRIGDIRKVIVRDGHRGPKKISVGPEFLEWLTDPELNGAGALTDFGCYGANLMTWLMDGRRPLTVTAVTQQLQAENNPEVEDEAIIILTYPDAVALLQPSWNWPMGRKDLEIYGLTGAVYADNGRDLRVRMAEGYDGFEEESVHLDPRPAPYDDPFAFLAAVVRGDISVDPTDLSALENNLTVVDILDAAKQSAASGRTVVLE
ncbi:putative dehydrogenase [Neolewinella xylanilytica]|uniref:Putative dehydrogenase n=1 Tax=Neolewinella xylanilytica TaxID=1514080 RepID=A0A2S6I790_9BACT|nr:Gfo/Idh/MocA family oxidoreductase [Neolewinella xylanilytica]PPK87371.1 putative dehydrogenase [Neolewinella xylanilytica]